MLVLSRRTGESIMIGDEVKLTIIAVHGNFVRIGITAPKSVIVHREEIYLAIQQDRASAGVVQP